MLHPIRLNSVCVGRRSPSPCVLPRASLSIGCHWLVCYNAAPCVEALNWRAESIENVLTTGRRRRRLVGGHRGRAGARRDGGIDRLAGTVAPPRGTAAIHKPSPLRSRRPFDDLTNYQLAPPPPSWRRAPSIDWSEIAAAVFYRDDRPLRGRNRQVHRSFKFKLSVPPINQFNANHLFLRFTADK